MKCLFGHKWVYKNQTGYKIRICSMCYKKQYHEESHLYKVILDEVDNMGPGFRTTRWVNVSLNMDELRDKKLKELGI